MSLPSAETHVAALVGRTVTTFLGREARIVGIEDGVVVVADDRSDERARVALADVQAGLDQLDADGAVPVTITALGPEATYVAAILVEVEGAIYGGVAARVVLADRPAAA